MRFGAGQWAMPRTGSPPGFPKGLTMFATGFLAGREMMEPMPQRNKRQTLRSHMGQGDGDALWFGSPLRSAMSRVADGGVTVTGGNERDLKAKADISLSIAALI